jgi:phosphohistidine phosphatase
MQLLVIRHGVAVEREVFSATGKNDDLRPLTTDGRRKMRGIARALRRMIEPDLLVSSPLTRALQTAEIVAAAYDAEIDETIESLRPTARFPDFAKWAAKQRAASTVAIFGHDPHLSGLVSWLMSGSKEPNVVLKKGGACLLSFDGAVRRAGATLEWLLQPEQLLRLGK